MRVFKRTSGAIKDRNSIWIAKFSRKGPFHNPDLQAVIIKATSHDDNCLDSKNVQRVFQWLRTSPLYLKPVVWSLSMRMQKTRSWVVALKGLMLIHGVFCCDIPVVQCIERLPFDLSNFSDGHLRTTEAWSFNAFVRAYFAYLDQRSSFVSSEFKKQINVDKEEVEETLLEELEKLQKLQGMIDTLLQIRPPSDNVNVGLILEAMNCVIVEVFGVYSKFCNRISKVLLRMYEVGGKMEASIGLKVLQKASIQVDEMSSFFEFCKDIGVLNASQCPKIDRISMEDIQDLERIINSKGGVGGGVNVVGNDVVLHQKESENGLMTVITHKWEVFDDDHVKVGAYKGAEPVIATTTNPFEEPYALLPYAPSHHQPLPDLISL